MSKRDNIQQLFMPPHIRQILRMIAEVEDRSKSASVRVMILRRAEELNIDVESEQTESGSVPVPA